MNATTPENEMSRLEEAYWIAFIALTLALTVLILAGPFAHLY